MLNWSGLGRDTHNYEDDEGDGEDGEEPGEDDVRLSLDLLRGGHLADGRVAEHQHELEAGGGSVRKWRRNHNNEWVKKPDEECGEEAAKDPDV